MDPGERQGRAEPGCLARRPSARCREYTPWIVNSNMHCWYQLMVFRGGEGLVLLVARQLERPLLAWKPACSTLGSSHGNLRVLPVGPSRSAEPHRIHRMMTVQVVMSTMVEWSTLPQESALLANKLNCLLFASCVAAPPAWSGCRGGCWPAADGYTQPSQS